MNKIIIMGNIGTKKDIIKTSDNCLLPFSVATTSYNGKENVTEWHKCTAFGKTAENIDKYFNVGDKILIEGAMRTNKKEDKYYTSIIVNSFEFTQKK